MSAEAISGIDHLLVVVSDLDRAAATYRRLGFTLSPRAVHSAHMGTANHTIMLERDYFELLGVLAPTEANVQWRRLWLAARGSRGLRRQRRAPPRPARRGVMQGLCLAAFLPSPELWNAPTGSGRKLDSKPSRFPRGRSRRCRSSPAPSSLVTQCGSIAAPAPLLAAESWSHALPGSMRVSTDSGAQIRLGSHVIEFLDPAMAARLYSPTKRVERATAIAIELEVMDVDTCREVLRRGGLSPQLHGNRTSVGSADACGVVIAFLPVGAPLA